MENVATTPQESPPVSARAAELLRFHQQQIWAHTDRLFVRLLVVEWIAGIVLACYLTPTTLVPTGRAIHPHVWQAIFLGGAILVSPLLLGYFKPGHAITRHVVAASQMLSSALLIHLGGGRIELHFHVFGSLAFLAFYRDWRTLVTASAVVAADHLSRGLFFPESVFGLSSAGSWRWLEHAGWVIFEDLFLIASCLRSAREMKTIADRQALLEHSHHTVEEKVRERTRELEELQHDMVKVARAAGMADIATSVLHNVGNVLNSVNVSLSVATTKVQQSPVNNLARAVGLLAQHKDDLPQFLTADNRGKQLPAYLQSVSEILSGEQTALLEEMNSLTKNVDHIKEIVHLQQSNAKATDLVETVNLASLIDDALRVSLAAVDPAAIDIRRDTAGTPLIRSDKHAILQILINLTGNAKQALLSSPTPEKRITIRSSTCDTPAGPRVQLHLSDNGVGIDPANLDRIFNHGFTTKKEGHGFGLHSSANAAKRLGGSLTVHSDGPGTGATFTLDLPIHSELLV